MQNAFNNSSPDYYVGLNLNIPIRNRVAKADQYRSELEYRQAELRKEQLKKQIRIEVRNAQYALDQTGARVEAARKARDLAQRTFEITKKEQELGAGSSYQTMTAQRDLALSRTGSGQCHDHLQKAKVELDRATGTTLEHNGMLIQDAISGTVSTASRNDMPTTVKAGELSSQPFRSEVHRDRFACWRPTISRTFSKLSTFCCVRRATAWTKSQVSGGRRASLASNSYDAVLIDLNYTRDTTSGQEGLDLLSEIVSLKRLSGHRHDGMGQCGTGGGSHAPRGPRFHPEAVGERAPARDLAHAGRTASRPAACGAPGS